MFFVIIFWNYSPTNRSLSSGVPGKNGTSCWLLGESSAAFALEIYRKLSSCKFNSPAGDSEIAVESSLEAEVEREVAVACDRRSKFHFQTSFRPSIVCNIWNKKKIEFFYRDVRSSVKSHWGLIADIESPCSLSRLDCYPGMKCVPITDCVPIVRSL